MFQREGKHVRAVHCSITTYSRVHFLPERLKGEIIVFTGEHRPPRKSHKLVCNTDSLLAVESSLCYVITVIKTSHSPCSFLVFQAEQTINYLHVEEEYPFHPSHVHLLAFKSLSGSEVECANLSAGLIWFPHWRIISPIHKIKARKSSYHQGNSLWLSFALSIALTPVLWNSCDLPCR